MRALLKKGSTRHEPIEINATVADVVRLIRGDAASRGISIDVDLAADLGPVVGDRIQVQQVVLNLLMNACDAVQGQETWSRRVGLKTARNGTAAIVEVRDRGAGLTDAELGRIFEPFYTTKPDGMGLGLSICRAIVGTHGGTLEAVRHPDGGMTLSATFPFLAAVERNHREPWSRNICESDDDARLARNSREVTRRSSTNANRSAAVRLKHFSPTVRAPVRRLR